MKCRVRRRTLNVAWSAWRVFFFYLCSLGTFITTLRCETDLYHPDGDSMNVNPLQVPMFCIWLSAWMFRQNQSRKKIKSICRHIVWAQTLDTAGGCSIGSTAQYFLILLLQLLDRCYTFHYCHIKVAYSWRPSSVRVPNSYVLNNGHLIALFHIGGYNIGTE